MCYKINSDAVCNECQPLTTTHYQRCQSCALLLKTHNKTLKYCGECLLSNNALINQTWTVYDYHKLITHLIGQFKYRHKLFVGDFFAKQIAYTYNQIISKNKPYDRIIPMPLHKTRLKERGFNQSLELLAHLKPSSKTIIDTTSLIRKRATPPFHTLSKEKRFSASKQLFGIGEHIKPIVKGERILLVDDIITTTSSINSLARTIKEHQSSVKIDALCLARAELKN